MRREFPVRRLAVVPIVVDEHVDLVCGEDALEDAHSVPLMDRRVEG